MTQQTMGQRIAEKRRSRSLAQEALAEQLSVTPQAVSEWENDVNCPDVLLVCPNGDVMQFNQPMELVKRDMEERIVDMRQTLRLMDGGVVGQLLQVDWRVMHKT